MSQLSFGSSSSNISPYLENQYLSQYNNALGLNQQNYNNILSNYGANQSNIGAGTAGVAAGYGQLGQQVQGTIQGIGASQSQAIQDVYAQQSGQLGQSLINSGLGNTTVSAQMQRGPMLDAQKAQVALSNQLAQLSAGYQAQLGGAGLQAQLQGTGLQAQAGNVLGGNLASYKTPYPNQPPLVSQSAQQAGGGAVRGGSGGAGVGAGGLWAGGQGGSYTAPTNAAGYSYPTAAPGGYQAPTYQPPTYDPSTGQISYGGSNVNSGFGGLYNAMAGGSGDNTGGDYFDPTGSYGADFSAGGDYVDPTGSYGADFSGGE